MFGDDYYCEAIYSFPAVDWVMPTIVEVCFVIERLMVDGYQLSQFARLLFFPF